MEKFKNQLIIFSKNRACQLHLLLESISINAPNIFDRINVLYKSDENFKNGYKKLNDFFGNKTLINFIEEKNFRNDFINLINDNCEFTTLMVDDAVFYNKITIDRDTILDQITSDHICFSLRLGLNCNYSHPANLKYSIGEYKINDDFVTIDYTIQSKGDFNYPLSTDGHIFKTKTIKNMIKQILFIDPNTLEAQLQKFLNNENIVPKKMSFFKTSKLVGIPVNLVNKTHKNRYGLNFGISENDLNNLYISGKIIDLKSMNFLDINGPHKEIKYEFK